MNTMTWLNTGASWMGLKTMRSMATPPMKESTMHMKKAIQ